MRLSLIAIALATSICVPAFAADPNVPGSTVFQATGPCTTTGVCPGKPIGTQNPLVSADQNGAAFSSAITMTPGGSAVSVGRSVEMLITTAGNVSLQLGGAPHIISVSASPYTQTFPYAVTAINSSGTTAVATYANLY